MYNFWQYSVHKSKIKNESPYICAIDSRFFVESIAFCRIYLIRRFSFRFLQTTPQNLKVVVHKVASYNVW